MCAVQNAYCSLSGRRLYYGLVWYAGVRELNIAMMLGWLALACV